MSSAGCGGGWRCWRRGTGGEDGCAAQTVAPGMALRRCRRPQGQTDPSNNKLQLVFSCPCRAGGAPCVRPAPSLSVDFAPSVEPKLTTRLCDSPRCRLPRYPSAQPACAALEISSTSLAAPDPSSPRLPPLHADCNAAQSFPPTARHIAMAATARHEKEMKMKAQKVADTSKVGLSGGRRLVGRVLSPLFPPTHSIVWLHVQHRIQWRDCAHNVCCVAPAASRALAEVCCANFLAHHSQARLSYPRPLPKQCFALWTTMETSSSPLRSSARACTTTVSTSTTTTYVAERVDGRRMSG